jgi:hypothetical protein
LKGAAFFFVAVAKFLQRIVADVPTNDPLYEAVLFKTTPILFSGQFTDGGPWVHHPPGII